MTFRISAVIFIARADLNLGAVALPVRQGPQIFDPGNRPVSLPIILMTFCDIGFAILGRI